MFNAKKDLESVRDGIRGHFDEIKDDFSVKLDETKNAIRELYKEIQELKGTNINHNEQVKKDLLEINTLKNEFERALNKVQSMSYVIEETTKDSVREVAQKEIESIQANSAKFRELENELRATTQKIHYLQLEISKFISISQQINLVDFSLKSHKQDIEKYERERNDLMQENERLKTIMARMKRNST